MAEAAAATPAYMQLIAELQARARFGMHPGLERTTWLLARLGHPERAFPAVHVAGTNGKGATAAGIAAILQAAGERVGLFTSPHLVCPRERVALNGRPIAVAAFVAAGRRVLQAADRMEQEQPQWGPATQFELYTALAFLAFAQAKVDVAVVEVGLGGRLDSTNVLQPIVSVLTPIGLDHREVLGPTLADIAREKAAILKPGSAWVIAPQPAEALAVVRARLHAMAVEPATPPAPAGRNGPLIWVTSRDEPGASWSPDPGCESGLGLDANDPVRWEVKCEQTDWTKTSLRVTRHGVAGGGRADQTWTIPLAGRHQAVNGAVALAAAVVAGLRLGLGQLAPRQLQTGLDHLRWPGRLEQVAGGPRVVLDGAHNPSAGLVLAQACADLKPNRPLILVFGILAAKQWQAVLDALLPGADGMVATAPTHPRTPAVAPAVLADYARRTLTHERVSVVSDPRAAVNLARTWAGTGGTVLVCGSLYLVGDVRPAFTRDWYTYADADPEPSPTATVST